MSLQEALNTIKESIYPNIPAHRFAAWIFRSKIDCLSGHNDMHKRY